MVLSQALHLVLTSIATGLLASAALTRLLAGLLFEVEPLDPTTFAATSLALLTIANGDLVQAAEPTNSLPASGTSPLVTRMRPRCGPRIGEPC
jgi:hypothetical protein